MILFGIISTLLIDKFFIKGSAALAKQMIMSIVHHASNVHSFPELNLYPSCLHGVLTGTRDYLPKGNSKYIKH